MTDAPVRDVLEFAIGGGWGQETEFEDSVPVRVIRGTDFERIRNGNYSEVPARYEKASKAKRRILKPGDIVLEISGGSRTSNQSTGRSFLISEAVLANLGEIVIPASFCRLVRFDRNTIDPRYAYYALQEMYVSGRAALYEQQSTGISNFQFEYFLDSEVISLPPLEEQRAIARVLGALDDKIELNRRMSETLEEMARALFRSWFVDFDPVHAKAEGRPSGLPPDLDALFPASFEASELGEIPAGWEVTAISSLTSINDWTLRAKDELEFIDYIEISAVSAGTIERMERYARGEEPSRARRRLRHGDTVLSTVRPDRGSYFLCLDPTDSLVASTGFAVITPTSAPWAFVHTAMTQPDLFQRLGYLADGAAYPAVRPNVVGEAEIAWGGPAIAARFHEAIAPNLELSARGRRQSNTLEGLRDALLPRLVSGELRVAMPGGREP